MYAQKSYGAAVHRQQNRQPRSMLIVLRTRKSSFFSLCLKGGKICTQNGITAVSYTHLDVYKRQGHRSTAAVRTRTVNKKRVLQDLDFWVQTEIICGLEGKIRF